MEKTYVLIGTYGQHEDKVEDILYAGQDESVAVHHAIGVYEELTLQTWKKGVKILEHSRKNHAGNWLITFDKVAELKGKIDKKKSEMADLEEALKEIECIKG